MKTTSYLSPMSKLNSYLTALPNINGRYVVFDTETTGLNPSENNVIEIAAVEIQNGKLTGNQFHTFLKPRYKMSESAESKHKMSQDFYEKYYSNAYLCDKKSLENFVNFVNNSFIFAHNAVFDMNFINNELQFWDLPQIPKRKFRCTMKLFKKMVEPASVKKNFSLEYCCNFFHLNSVKENFHSAIFDAFMTARMVCCLMKYEPNKNETNHIINSKNDYNQYQFSHLSNVNEEDLENDFLNVTPEFTKLKRGISPCKSHTDSSGHTKDYSGDNDSCEKNKFDEPITLDSSEMEGVLNDV